MKNYPHPIIAREGWPFLAISLVLAIAVSVWCASWATPLWIIFIFVLQFFRDPARVIPQETGVVLSACDGRVIKVERAQDPYAEREAILVSVFMNVFNVHSNRSPADGTVQKVQYFPGKFVNADLDKASTHNERNARRILCYIKAGDTLARGQRYGFIRFGSRVDVYLPLTATVKVAIGDKVSATSTILAKL
jgi:phosphatidylserine decarboxylase